MFGGGFPIAKPKITSSFEWYCPQDGMHLQRNAVLTQTPATGYLNRLDFPQGMERMIRLSGKRKLRNNPSQVKLKPGEVPLINRKENELWEKLHTL